MNELDDTTFKNMVLYYFRTASIPLDFLKKEEEDVMFDCFMNGMEYECKLDNTKAKQTLLQKIKSGMEGVHSDIFIAMQNAKKDEQSEIENIIRDNDFWNVYGLSYFTKFFSFGLSDTKQDDEETKDLKSRLNHCDDIRSKHEAEYAEMIEQAKRIEESKGNMSANEYQKLVASYKAEMKAMKERHKKELETLRKNK